MRNRVNGMPTQTDIWVRPDNLQCAQCDGKLLQRWLNDWQSQSKWDVPRSSRDGYLESELFAPLPAVGEHVKSRNIIVQALFVFIHRGDPRTKCHAANVQYVATSSKLAEELAQMALSMTIDDVVSPGSIISQSSAPTGRNSNSGDNSGPVDRGQQHSSLSHVRDTHRAVPY